MTELSIAGQFNPANRMFLPIGGIDYSSYLGSGNPVVFPQVPVNMQIPVTQNPIAATGAVNSGANVGYMYNPLQIKAEGLTLIRAARNIDKSIENNEVDRIATDFNAFKQIYTQSSEYKMLTRGQEIDDKMVTEMAAEKYRTITGVDLTDRIDDNVRGNFFAGLWSGATLGLVRFKSNDDVKQEIFGENKHTKAKAANGVGGILGGAATGAATGAALGLCGGPLAPLTSTAGAIGGAIVGAIGGLISRIWS